MPEASIPLSNLFEKCNIISQQFSRMSREQKTFYDFKEFLSTNKNFQD